MDFKRNANDINQVISDYNEERNGQIEQLENSLLGTIQSDCELLSVAEVVGVLEHVKFNLIAHGLHKRIKALEEE